MEPYAIASCVLRVDVRCKACKMTVLEVLGSICGVYDVDIDAGEGLVYVYGAVDPNFLMKALARTGNHATVERVKLQHPQARRTYYDDYDIPRGFGLGPIDDPYYRYSRALPYYGYSNYRYPYAIGAGSSYYPGPRLLGLPPARYVPSYPPKEYDPYDDEPTISLCSIM